MIGQLHYILHRENQEKLDVNGPHHISKNRLTYGVVPKII